MAVPVQVAGFRAWTAPDRFGNSLWTAARAIVDAIGERETTFIDLV
jgi:hypothetical protein